MSQDHACNGASTISDGIAVERCCRVRRSGRWVSRCVRAIRYHDDNDATGSSVSRAS
jgi:hypothetical protein